MRYSGEFFHTVSYYDCIRGYVCDADESSIEAYKFDDWL